MKKLIRNLCAAAGIIVGTLPVNAFSATQLDHNLIVNGDAEASPGAQDFTSVQAPTGWTTTSNFTALKYNISFNNQIGGANVAILGANYFAGGPNNSLSSASQIIDVSDRATEIDAGSLYAVLEGLFGGLGNSSDYMEMRAEFLSTSQTVITTKVVPTVDVLDRPGATFNMVPRSTSRLVPAGTRSIRVVLESTRIDAETYNDGYADNVSLKLIKDASTIVVLGSANPYLAHAEAGTSAQGDSAPGNFPQSVIPAEVSGLVTLPNAQETFYFYATGGTNYSGGAPTSGPDGDQFWTESPARGISGAVYPLNSLVGVFLDERTLQPNDTPPASLDFSSNGNVPGGVDYTELSPAIGQLFFIGDGFTSSGVGQKVKAPVGATRLYLGSTDGTGWFNNSGAFTVLVSKKPITVGPTLPPHGGLSATTFTVNESAQPGYPPAGTAVNGLSDTILRFAAMQNSNAANLYVRVQATTTPAVEGSWTDLADTFGGRMTLDVSTNPDEFVLHSTNYPPSNGVYFRSISAAGGFSDSISNVVGPFNLQSSAGRVGPAYFTIFSNTTPGNITPGHAIHFGASRPPAPTNVSVRVQYSTTPHDESSWTDLPNGTMTPGASEDYALDSAAYPTGDAVYFRAYSSRSGFVPDASNVIGPFKLVQTTPPSVTINPPAANTNPTGNGANPGSPIVLKASSGGQITFNFSADAASNRQIVKTELLMDGSVIDYAASQHASTQFTTNVYGIHELRAIATDDQGARADAAPVYVIIHPAGGKVYTFIAESGDWFNAGNWLVFNSAQTGVPGPKDLAIIAASTVTLSGDASVFALVLNGGKISGAHNLNVIGATFAGGTLQDLTLNIDSHGVCVLTGDSDLAMNGTLNNYGRLQLTGLGGIVGIPTSGLSASQVMHKGGANPNDFGGFIRGICNNIGKALFPKRAAPKQTTTVRGVQVQKPVIDAKFVNAGRLIANDGGSLITNDGGSRPAPGMNQAAVASGFEQTSGETDLGTADSYSQLAIFGDVTLNGGALTGSGRIHGNLINNGGFISPGHSAGRIEVGGDFMQASGGTLIIENGGLAPSQFDQLVVDGTGTLGGALHLKNIDGFVSDPADAFNPLSFGAVNGSFDSVSANGQVNVTSTGVSTTLNPNVAGAEPGRVANISTRMRVLTGDKVLIGGFIITGPSGSTKKVLIRGIGPSLSNAVAGALADPIIELHLPDGSTEVNDDWAQGPRAGEIPAGFQPNAKESVIVADLAPGAYTVIESGNNGGTGIGLTEVYDLDPASLAKLANISTRGFVDTGDNVMIGGFIIQGTEPVQVVVRATAPSLKDPPANLTGVLEDPTLDLIDGNGNAFASDNWRESQAQELIATTLQPRNEFEPAILTTLVPGAYTAIVRGKDNTTGIGLVEIYKVE